MSPIMQRALFHRVTLTVLLAGAVACGPRATESTAQEITGDPLAEVLTSASEDLFAWETADGSFNFSYNLGSPQSSLFYMLYAWMGRDPSFIDPARFEALLRDEQFEDGSWGSFHDPNLSSGTLDTTIINYMAMKMLGVPTHDPSMSAARAFILAEGGAEEAIYPTQMLLALFDSYPWDEMTAPPAWLMDEDAWVSLDDFAQWIAPNFYPVIYMHELQLSKNLGERFTFRELAPGLDDFANEPRLPRTDGAEATVVDVLLETQQDGGSWGGYLGATLLSVVCLEDFAAHHPDDVIDAAVNRGLSFVTSVSSDAPQGNYEGVPSDGRYWDTALVINALAASGADLSSLRASGELLADAQSHDGGSPFGRGFETMPDLDDTALSILAWHALGGFEEPIARAIDWTLSMQNDDGGWAAFSKDNTVDSLLDWILSKVVGIFAPASFFYDASSADVTGHVLEALAASGLTRDSSHAIREGIDYLEDTQVRRRRHEQYMWPGTWGVGYLYGTSAAVVGLVSAGESPDEQYIADAIGWLQRCQNEDGGFGETTDAYDDPDLACAGVSTPTQTAWVIIALVAAGQADTQTVERAVAYLIAQHDQPGGWEDQSITGTGHPGFLYMEYLAYPKTFPLMALGRVRAAANDEPRRGAIVAHTQRARLAVERR